VQAATCALHIFRFSRQHSRGPIDAVMAMTFAAHGIMGAPPEPRIT